MDINTGCEFRGCNPYLMELGYYIPRTYYTGLNLGGSSSSAFASSGPDYSEAVSTNGGSYAVAESNGSGSATAEASALQMLDQVPLAMQAWKYKLL